METFAHFVSDTLGIPGGSALAIVALLLLLVVAIAMKARQRKQLAQATHSLSTALMPDHAAKEESTQHENRLSSAALPDTHSDTMSSSTAVYEVDPLEEVDIYLSYGHLEQAATTLRWYVEHHAQDVQNLKRLLEIYLEIPDLDSYAEIQERFCILFPQDPFCQDGIVQGLQADPCNLQLRVLAEAYLGMDIESVDALITQSKVQEEHIPFHAAPHDPREDLGAQISVNRVQSALKQAIVNPEPLDLSGIDLNGNDKSGGHAIDGQGRSIVEGMTVRINELKSDEIAVLNGFLSPLQVARLHQEQGEVEQASNSLRRGILFEPRKLAYHVELMQILHRHRQLEPYAEALLSLYLTLWGSGQSLRHRLLATGMKMGRHPLLEHLQDVDQGIGDLALLANAWGLHVPLAAIPFSNPPLVEERTLSIDMLDTSKLEDQTLHELDQLLEYGQVEEAIQHLEEAICTDPQNGRYYPPLMEMYERMSDLTRYTQFTESILQGEYLPSEDTLRLMIEVGERLKRHVNKRAV